MQVFSRDAVPLGLCLVVTRWTRAQPTHPGPAPAGGWIPRYRLGVERYLTPARARMAAAASSGDPGEDFVEVDAALVLHYDPETSIAEVVLVDGVGPGVAGSLSLPDQALGPGASASLRASDGDPVGVPPPPALSSES